MPVPVEQTCLGWNKLQDARPCRQASGDKTAAAYNHAYTKMHGWTVLGSAREGLQMSFECSCLERQELLPACHQTRPLANDTLLQRRPLLVSENQNMRVPATDTGMGWQAVQASTTSCDAGRNHAAVPRRHVLEQENQSLPLSVEQAGLEQIQGALRGAKPDRPADDNTNRAFHYISAYDSPNNFGQNHMSRRQDGRLALLVRYWQVPQESEQERLSMPVRPLSD